jgi:hypothetical protein
MPPGASGRKRSTENDTGAGPATVESPSSPASKTEEKSIDQSTPLADFKSAHREIMDVAGFLEPIEEGEGAELEIEAEFRRRLAGARKLPRHARAGARREAYEWRKAALRALREKRLLERTALRSMRLLKQASRCGL